MEHLYAFTPGQLAALLCLVFVAGAIAALTLLVLLSPKARKQAEALAEPNDARWPVDERGFPQRRAEDLLRTTHADVRRDRAARGG